VADSENPRPGGNAGALGEAYERLRDAVMAGGAAGWRLGHGVLSARGMTAWMTAVGELAPGSATSATSATGADGVASRFSSAGRELTSAETTVSLPDVDQVVAVLTQMVLPLAA
jgi:hypothetical protein